MHPPALNTTAEVQQQTLFVALGGYAIEVALYRHPAAARTILLLHEALGSVAYWKDFPEKLAYATGANVLLYSRAGQGNSDGPVSNRTLAAYLEEVDEIIPALLNHFAVDWPILYGHSEGAGLAMLYASRSQTVQELIVESPYLHTLKQSSDYIHSLAMTYEGSRLQQRLAHYHRRHDEVFQGWIDAIGKLGSGKHFFGDSLHEITCPVLVLQGQHDEFGTTPHLDSMQALLPHLEYEVFVGAAHLPHRQTTEAVLERVSRFLREQQEASTLKTQPLQDMGENSR